MNDTFAIMTYIRFFNWYFLQFKTRFKRVVYYTKYHLKDQNLNLWTSHKHIIFLQFHHGFEKQ